MTEGEEIFRAIAPVAEALERLGIGYFIGGSVASSLYGVARTTADADLIAAVEARHAEDLARSLEEDYYVDADMIRDAVTRGGMFNVVHYETALKVDVYVLKHSAWDEEAFRRRRAESPDDPPARTFQFGSPEDVLLHKLVWFRLGGETSDRQWKDVVGMLRVRRASLDEPYLDRWAPVLGIADLLSKARSEV